MIQKSEQLNELFSALAKAQTEMEVAGLNKTNPFYKSNYADWKEIVRSSRPALNKNGLCVIQSVNMVNDTLFLSSLLCHSSGQYISSEMKISPQKQDIQSIGSYITYCKRICYSALIGVVTGDDYDDDGEAAMDRSQSYEKPKEIITPDQYEQLSHELQGHLDIANNIKEKLKLGSLRDLPKSMFMATIDRIREIKRGKE